MFRGFRGLPGYEPASVDCVQRLKEMNGDGGMST